MRPHHPILALGLLGMFAACSGKPAVISKGIGGTDSGGTSTGGTGGTSSGGKGGSSGTGVGGGIIPPDGGDCDTTTCAGLGWACGYTVDACGTVVDCADEGLVCDANQICVGGIDGPTTCMTGGSGDCAVCSGIPDCSAEPQVTRLAGRVISPGRDDANTGNQVGVPNAIVYILRDTDVDALPPLTSGIPADGTSCDRCEDQMLGPVLTGAVTDASGNFVLEENIPVGVEIVLVVKAGKFRRAVTLTVPEEGACQTTMLPTALPDNPTRLPRTMTDGLAVNIPRIAVSTGQIDAMECVLEKMGIGHNEFGNPGATGAATERIHLYRGGDNTGTPPGRGARINDETPHDSVLYGDLARLEAYDIVVADCEGQSWDSSLEERDADGAKVREFVNRGGRMFASHLSFSWLHENGAAAYDAADPITTGLGPAATWSTSPDGSNTGIGAISVGRPSASPRVQNFADWMVNEGITTAPGYNFNILEPRSQNTALGATSEEFVYLSDGNLRVQQFSFNTPYGAPAEAACGRVAYSGFHVSYGGGQTPFQDVIFPAHCMGDLTAQEKVLLYMLFDLGACVGETPPPPPCTPAVCGEDRCGFAPDGCGDVLDCGPCRPPA